MAKLTLQQVSSILGKSAITKLNPATAVATTGIQAGKAISKEVFGYDFVGLVIKIVIFFTVAYLAEIYIRAKIEIEKVIKDPDKQVAVGSAFFGLAGIAFNYLYQNFKTDKEDPEKIDPVSSDFWSNEKIDQLFSEKGFHGFNYWSMIKIIAILLVIAEFSQYLKMNKALRAKTSSFTIGIFTLIIIALGLTTIPELIKRVKGTDFNLEAMR